MFIIKKIAASLCYPLSLCLGLLLIGLLLLWFTRRQRAGKLFVSLGVILLLIMGYGVFRESLIGPLEYRYPPLIEVSALSDVRWVAVLGGGQTSDPKLPANAQLSNDSLARLIEGIRLHKALAASKLILSGGAVYDPVPEAAVMARVASTLGVKKDNIIMEAESKDTDDQARFIKKIVGNERFLLVTSASHMPRSIGLFKKRAMQPIPAPTDFMLKEGQAGINPAMFFPWAGYLEMWQRAFHEYMGLAWAKLTD